MSPTQLDQGWAGAFWTKTGPLGDGWTKAKNMEEGVFFYLFKVVVSFHIFAQNHLLAKFQSVFSETDE